LRSNRLKVRRLAEGSAGMKKGGDIPRPFCMSVGAAPPRSSSCFLFSCEADSAAQPPAALAIHVSHRYDCAVPISIRLPVDVEDRLTALATLTGRSKTFYATEAIVEHIDDLEDAHLSAEILARIRAGTEARVPLTDLLAEHGLAD
jgi:RHH-type rel operon transcriptional repressor/antitoxin RelB